MMLSCAFACFLASAVGSEQNNDVASLVQLVVTETGEIQDTLEQDTYNHGLAPTSNVDITMGSWLGVGDQQLRPTATTVLPDGRVLVAADGGTSAAIGAFGVDPQTLIEGANTTSFCGSALQSPPRPDGTIVCCPKSCGECGMPGCSGRPGGKSKCCGSSITRSRKQCSSHAAPCIADGSIAAGGIAHHGVVLVIDPQKSKPDAVLLAGAGIYCARANSKGDVLITGDFGAAVFKMHGIKAHLKWKTPFPASLLDERHGPLCALADDGSAAALSGCIRYSFNNVGVALAKSQKPRGPGAEACTSIAHNNDAVYSTYWEASHHTGKEPIVMAGLRKQTTALKDQWLAYDYDPKQVRQSGRACNGNVADARATSISLGEDGQLYFVGRSDGGNTLFYCEPWSSKKKVLTTQIDKYTSSYNMRAQAITYVARLDPDSGAVDRGQVQLSRLLSNDAGNSLFTHTMAADSSGTMYLAQTSSCCIRNRNNLSVSGETVGPYGGDAVLMALSADMKSRHYWTAFNSASSTHSAAVDVDVRNGVVAFLATSKSKTPKKGKPQPPGMILVNALDGTSGPTSANIAGAYLVILPAVSDPVERVPPPVSAPSPTTLPPASSGLTYTFKRKDMKCVDDKKKRLFKRSVRTVEECAKACKEKKGCGFFSYASTGGDIKGLCMGCGSMSHMSKHEHFNFYELE